MVGWSIFDWVFGCLFPGFSNLGSKAKAHTFCWVLLDKSENGPFLFVLDFRLGLEGFDPSKKGKMAQWFGPLRNQKTILQISPWISS